MATSFDFNSFARRMNVIAERVEANTEKKVRRAALAADQTAVLATPVDTGRARGNWRVDIGNPVFTFDPELKDPSGAGPIAQGAAVAQTWRVGAGPIFISNSVPYIGRLDEGYSAQAPTGMSALAIQAARRELGRGALLDGV